MIARQRFAVDKGLGNVSTLGQFRLDPFRVDVAPVTGDELVFFATFEVKKTFRVELAKIPAWPPLFGIGWIT